MALRDLIELRESLQRAVAALFGTSVLVVITLTTLKIGDLDAALRSAVHFFVWAAVLLGAYLILSVTSSLSVLTKPLWRRLFGGMLSGVGILTWLRGAYYVLMHYQVSGIEIVFMQTLIVASIILSAADVSESASDLKQSLASVEETLDALKEVQREHDENVKSQNDGIAEAEPKRDSK
ncbi:hypothetical protein NL30_17140 [Burkholderia contaminans]|uniref:hypothetical protein n=1 Tax=Burkholderia contaminans TaxID=488447 RepID=UPI00064B497C|nr:hypothetical protein [Burkholderia contaminans]AKM41687.1 hypothetical protein NL30_17140 [Burkholderia contaminans]